MATLQRIDCEPGARAEAGGATHAAAAAGAGLTVTAAVSLYQVAPSTLASAPKAGGAVRVLVSGAGAPIYVGVWGRDLYYTDFSAGTVRRYNLDTGAVALLFPLWWRRRRPKTLDNP